MSAKILLIGGTHGISEALQERLEAAGDEVVTIARSDAATHSTDVTDSEEPLPEIEGKFDGLVYCPGTVNLKPFKQLKEDDFLNDFKINVVGAFRVIQQYTGHIREGGSIVLFSSVAVKVGMPFHVSIASAKGAVEGFVRALAAELCPKVRVNAVAPSLTETPLTEKLVNTDAKKEASANRHPLGRIGTPDDQAAAAQFLLSENASWITGQVIGVDGGLSTLRLIS